MENDWQRKTTNNGKQLVIANNGKMFHVKHLNADKHSPATSARSTKRRVRGDAYVSGSWKLPLTDREATVFMSK